MNDNERMNAKQYAKFEKTYMAFGSTMNGLQRRFLTLSSKDAQALHDYTWEWSKRKVSEFVDEIYKEMETKSQGSKPL